MLEAILKYFADAIRAIKSDVIALGIPFEQAAAAPVVVQKIQLEFPGMSYRRIAREAWAEIVADGELEIRRSPESGQYSIWFLSGAYRQHMWEGNEHRQATSQAIIIERQQFAGVGVVDRAELPERVLVHRRLKLTTFARGARMIRGKA